MDEKSRKICVNTASYSFFNKTTYSAHNSELASFLRRNDIGKIYLCGVDAHNVIFRLEPAHNMVKKTPKGQILVLGAGSRTRFEKRCPDF